MVTSTRIEPKPAARRPYRSSMSSAASSGRLTKNHDVFDVHSHTSAVNEYVIGASVPDGRSSREKPVRIDGARPAIMAGPVNTSTIDQYADNGAADPCFDAPGLGLLWTSNEESTASGILHVAMQTLVADGTLPITGHVELPGRVTVDELEALGLRLVRLDRDAHGSSVFMSADGIALTGYLGAARTSLRTGAVDLVTSDVWEHLLRGRAKEPAPTRATTIRSWTMGRFGPTADHLTNEFVPWTESRANFPTASRHVMDQLVAVERPVGGSMMVWHGRPGTGKTTAIRSLAREWSPWCDVELVVDPEAFLGSASYLMGVLTEQPIHRSNEVDHRPADDSPTRWKLVVVEDCDELLHARSRAGSSGRLSRLLNVSDGVIGQETNVIMLFTTNAPLSAVHPAVLRPGRCLATVEFRPFSVAEVAERDSDLPAREMTLAELMAAEGGLPAVLGATSEEPTSGYL